jgi:aerobic-type carbon monoxide dehydrogenase small subunit (CoxS/CutS family)
MSREIRFTLNGESRTISTDPERPLLWVLRDDLGLTGTKFGCGEGLCGTCTVLVDGRAVRSCRMPAGDVQGKQVTTIEGLAAGEELHPVQRAFMEHDALQCGYCTPGMILQAVSLLAENPDPSRDEIIGAMDDNLCRCGAHKRIVEAIETAAANMKEGS